MYRDIVNLAYMYDEKYVYSVICVLFLFFMTILLI